MPRRLSGKRRRIGGADCSQCRCSVRGRAKRAGFRKLDDGPGDHFVSEVEWAVNSRTSRFECDAHETGGLRIEGLAV
jgi:hypothetical protein